METTNSILLEKKWFHFFPFFKDSLRRLRGSMGLLFLLMTIQSFSLQAQRDLKPVEDEMSSIIGGLTGGTNKIERTTLTNEDERSVTLSIRLSGFDDKEYTIQTAILNRSKEPMVEMPAIVSPMPKSKQLDIQIEIAELKKAMATPWIESKFVRLRVAPKEGGISGALGEAFDGINLNAMEFLYELDKKWMLIGPLVRVNVPLTPYKGAASINPN